MPKLCRQQWIALQPVWKHWAWTTFYPPGSSAVGLDRSSQSELEGLHAFVKAGLSRYWVWAVLLLFPFTRGLEGWIWKFPFSPRNNSGRELGTNWHSWWLDAEYKSTNQWEQMLRRSVLVDSRLNISQINQANTRQQGISSLQISRLWITPQVFKNHSKQST